MHLLRVRSVGTPTFNELMSLFSELMNKELQTKVEDIAYWIRDGEQKGSEYFHSIAIVNNGNIIGYFQLAYITGQQVAIIDNMMLIPEYRTFRVFSEACSLLSEYIAQTLPDCLYVLTEMAHPKSKCNKSDNPEKLTKLLLRKGFVKLPVSYISVSDPTEGEDADIVASLLVKSVPAAQRIDTVVMVGLLDAIYCGHYLTWYSCGPHDQERYKQRVKCARMLSMSSIGLPPGAYNEGNNIE